MGDTAIRHAFLVGCPRSGTTLLQSLLFAHPEVVSFPETFFFRRVVSGEGSKRKRLGLASPKASTAIDELRSAGLVLPSGAPPRWRPATVREYARYFQRAADETTRAAGGTLWLEKTPDHVRHLDEITRHIDDARCVHIIRQGEAVIASLRDVGNKHPEVWAGAQTVEGATGLWVRAIQHSVRWVGVPGHAFVSYERLVADTPGTLQRLCAFLDLPVDDVTLERMLSDYGDRAGGVVGQVTDAGALASEPWKAGVTAEIADRNRAKVDAVFSAEEREQVAAAVADQQDALARVPFV